MKELLKQFYEIKNEAIKSSSKTDASVAIKNEAIKSTSKTDASVAISKMFKKAWQPNCCAGTKAGNAPIIPSCFLQ